MTEIIFHMNKPKEDLLCYCFNYTAADIRADYLKNGNSTIIEKITEMKRGQRCSCATKNPSGR